MRNLFLRSPLLAFKGQVKTQIYDALGQPIGPLIVSPNAVCNVGKNHALDRIFNSASAITTWYMGLIDSSGYSAISVTDTMASHAGWTEFTGYSESVRQTWDPSAASGQAVVNASLVTFTASGSGTIKGIFICSVNTKGDTTGTLWATALFTSPVSVTVGNSVKNTYTVSC